MQVWTTGAALVQGTRYYTDSRHCWWIQWAWCRKAVSAVGYNQAAANTAALLVGELVSLPAVVRAMFDQVEQLVRLLLVISASSCDCEAERSFSNLRRLKTYLRSSMLQDRIPHCAILHVHQLHLDNLNIEDIARDFVETNDTRRLVFVKYVMILIALRHESRILVHNSTFHF